MAWLNLGTVTPTQNLWQETTQSATNQNLVRLTYISAGLITTIKSRLLVKRVWQIDEELPIEEKATVIYPSPNHILLDLPALSNYVDSNLENYKIQVKRYYPFRRAIIVEPTYSLRIEVS
jgi:hypothetical protein